MSLKSEQKQRGDLNRRISTICRALNDAEPSRLLMRWRKNADPEVVEAMRRAIKRVDGVLEVTTDALVAAFDAALYRFTRRTHP